MRHSSRVDLALARLPEVDPAIAALALWCQYREGTGPTQTAGETIFVGPEFAHLPISEQTGLIAHHVLHVAFRHSARRAAAQDRYGPRFRPMLYDLACDAMVNEALLQGQHALPRPAVRAAEIAARLPVADRPRNILADWDVETLYAVLAAQAGSGPGDNREGDPVTRYAEAQGFASDLKGADPNATEPEVWAGRIDTALQAGRRAGSGIGAVLVRFGDLPQASVPWEIRLRRLLVKALATHRVQSYRRPSQSWLARDASAMQAGRTRPAFDPALRRETQRPRLVVALDTSSSITDAMLEMFASEALSLLRRNGPEAHLIGFDTEVHSHIPLASAQDLLGHEMRRDGGTDFGPMLALAAGLDPSLIIVLTDLDAPTPADISARILWVVPAPPDQTPACGEVLVMDQPGVKAAHQ